MTNTKTSVGLQAVNHYNQFTSVTINYNLVPGVADSDATNFIDKNAAEIIAGTPGVLGTFQGEALVFKQLVTSLIPLIAAAFFVMYIILGILYESYVHPLTVLSTLPPAIVGGLGTLWVFHSTLSLYSIIGAVPADGHREEKRHHDRGLRHPAARRRAGSACGDPRGERRAFPADHDDDIGGLDGGRCRSRWGMARTARRASRWGW